MPKFVYNQVSESQIERAIVEYAESKGWRSTKQEGTKGKPDRYFTKYPKRIIFIEFKTKTGVLSSSQKREIKALQEEKHEVFVVSSIKQGKSLFDLLG